MKSWAHNLFDQFYLLRIIYLQHPTVTLSSVTHIKTCPEGKYLFQFDGFESLCVECPNETFMPWKNHTEKKCFECQKIKDRSLEIFTRPCNRFRDADIQCVDGYFRHLGEKPSCIKCRPSCPEPYVQVHRCENFTDIGCCPGKNYDYGVSEKGIRFCREWPWMCGRGQYLDENVNGCKPCPENTFMPENYHPFTKCWDCQYVSDADLPLHVVLTEPCKRTNPPQYGCKDGFYVNHNISYGNNIGCSQCQTCDEGMYVGRKCDMYHDTVCCDKANMSVVYLPHGELCIDETEEVHLSPYMETLSVREGGCQSVLCYTTLVPGRKKPELRWVGPNVDKHQQAQFEEKGNQTAETVYFNTLKVCDFSAADEGNYECRYTVDNLTQASQIYIKLEGKNGTYNTPTCNKHCREGERSDKSHCDDNGVCLFGCMDGYEGAKCDTRLDTYEGKNNTYSIPVCDKTCNKHCREGERSDKSQCDDNGICLFGCMDGYEGAKCDTRLVITDTGYNTSTVVAFCMIALTAGFSLGLVVLIILIRRFGTTSRARPRCLGRLVQMILPQNTCQACRDSAAERVRFKKESTSTGSHYVGMPEASPTGTASGIQKPEYQNLLPNEKEQFRSGS